MKKRLTVLFITLSVILSTAGLVLLLPQIFSVLMISHYEKSGIEKYNPADSSIELVVFLTLRDESKADKSSSFINKFKMEDGFYRYVDDTGYIVSCETAILAIKYNEANYNLALADIESQEGFSNKIMFLFGDFSFFLNISETYGRTDYCIEGEDKYIHWINLVGYSNLRKELVFIGFYYVEYHGFFKNKEQYYRFYDWDSLFNEQLNYYSWKKEE